MMLQSQEMTFYNISYIHLSEITDTDTKNNG